MQIKQILNWMIIGLLLGVITPVFSQGFYAYNQPRVSFGGDAAFFRISFDDFDEIYSNKWGGSVGAFASARFYRSYYAVFKYGQFSKSGKSGTYKDTDFNLENAKWDEKWYKIGVRVHPPIDSKFSSYYGFGIGFFDVKEAVDISIFTVDETATSIKAEADNDLGSGFYLELGIEYFPVPFMAIYGEFDISSGSYNGRPGFEATSVGGYRLSAGIAIYPF